MRPVFKERCIYSHYNTLIKERRLVHSLLYFNFTRMSPTTFEELAQLVGPRLVRESFRHDVISVGEILGATLRYIILLTSYISYNNNKIKCQLIHNNIYA